jgi:hypothetical protein
VWSCVKDSHANNLKTREEETTFDAKSEDTSGGERSEERECGPVNAGLAASGGCECVRAGFVHLICDLSSTSDSITDMCEDMSILRSMAVGLYRLIFIGREWEMFKSCRARVSGQTTDHRTFS